MAIEPAVHELLEREHELEMVAALFERPAAGTAGCYWSKGRRASASRR